ncbi:hypothetical protein [Simplicispira lacusdiani]|uniref:hypothetical protein n=1 Tax=Simplicispira lacusdiani TaxID=2213010 RepID=UPI000E74644D|nr:hypothetical protein [Simplicispira lacusdiani]
MADPITTVGLGALAAYLGKDGLEKLLGPTADYLGSGLKDFTQKRAEAVGRIFVSAQGKLGAKADTPGEVPPKVLKNVINEGSYASDPLAVEYFGGILASARTEGGRDDRSARLAKIVDSLSTYQLRAHFLIYATVRRLFIGKNLPFNMEGRPKMQFFVSLDDFANSMVFDANEKKQFVQLLNHIFFGLHGENLIEGHFQYGDKEAMVKVFAAAPDGGIVCQPSALGAELFLSAFGMADKHLDEIFLADFPELPDGVPNGFPEAMPTKV